MVPPLSVASLISALAGGAAFHYRYFWGHRPTEDGRIGASCLSQWWPCRFEVDGEAYRSAEHFMMASKARLFGDEAARDAILAAGTPEEAKRLGRQVRGYSEARWSERRFELVTAGNLAKFEQDPALGAFLLGTGDDVLAEASPTDAIWGIGAGATDLRARDPRAWPGLNLLGFALMRTRSILRAELERPA